MSVYKHFARHYQSGPYTRFTQRVSEEIFPYLCESLNFQPTSLLDLACGSGEFAIAQAKKGLHVTGLDQSADLLTLAGISAQENKAHVTWVEQDMAKLSLNAQVDCITCFFDSLNYLVRIKDLADTFKGAYAHLNPGGYFIFDMNTVYGLAVLWQKNPVYIQQDLPDYLEIAENSFNFEINIAQMRLIMFEKQEQSWFRHEEIHIERGYVVDDVLLLLETAGFELVYLVGNPLTLADLTEKDGRMWVVARKPLKSKSH